MSPSGHLETFPASLGMSLVGGEADLIRRKAGIAAGKVRSGGAFLLPSATGRPLCYHH